MRISTNRIQSNCIMWPTDLRILLILGRVSHFDHSPAISAPSDDVQGLGRFHTVQIVAGQKIIKRMM
jgi:hypothetical protein